MMHSNNEYTLTTVRKSLKTFSPISTNFQLNTEHPWVKGFQGVFLNEGTHPYPRGDNVMTYIENTLMTIENNLLQDHSVNFKTWYKDSLLG